MKADAHLYRYSLRIILKHGYGPHFDTLETAEPCSRILKFHNLSRWLVCPVPDDNTLQGDECLCGFQPKFDLLTSIFDFD